MRAIHKSIWVVLIFSGLLLFGSLLAGYKKDMLSYYFQEGESVTFFSAVFLWSTALICLYISTFQHRLDQRPPFFNFWFFSSIGFFYLCLDEFFMIHEGMDRWILESLGQNPNSLNFDGWILAIFGLIGLFLFYKFKDEILRIKDFVVLFTIAFVCFVIMVLLDQLGPEDATKNLIEDLFKYFSVVIFFLSYLAAFHYYLQRLFVSKTENHK